MNKERIIAFAQQYQSALHLHLSESSSAQSSSHAVQLLGQEATEIGINTLDLVSIHDRAVSNISSFNPDKKQKLSDKLTPSSVFLVELLHSIDECATDTIKGVRSTLVETEQQLKDEIARYDRLLNDSRRFEVQSRHLAHQLLLEQEEERREISRELHDEVAQILAGINVRLAALREGGVINFQSFEQSIQQTQQMIEESVDVVHRFAKKLRPAILDDLGLIPALRSLVKELPRPPNLELLLEVVPDAESLDKVRSTVVYRVINEALMNVIRHADAHCVRVRLKSIHEGIRVEVQDDGKSFDVEYIFVSKSRKRLGLLGMKERVEMVGGTFTIKSENGKGTTISADIPFIVNTEEDAE